MRSRTDEVAELSRRAAALRASLGRLEARLARLDDEPTAVQTGPFLPDETTVLREEKRAKPRGISFFAGVAAAAASAVACTLLLVALDPFELAGRTSARTPREANAVAARMADVPARARTAIGSVPVAALPLAHVRGTPSESVPRLRESSELPVAMNDIPSSRE